METDSFELRVADVVPETADAHSISFEVPTGLQRQFSYQPGQFLTIAVPSDRTGVVGRCYSLSSSPLDSGSLTITVKRTAGGYASNWICDNLRPGGVLRTLRPSGTFTPRSLDADLMLLAGGSGITPMMSIVRTALAAGTGRIALFYANRDEQSIIFGRELAALAAAHPDRLCVAHWLESRRGLPGPEAVKAFAVDRLSYDGFCCGPTPFMAMVMSALKELGLPRERRKLEKYVSLSGNPFGDRAEAAQAIAEIAAVQGDNSRSGAVALEAELDGTVYRFDDWGSGSTLVEYLESKGVKVPYSCREGECSACAVRLVEGEVEMANNEVLDDDDLAEGIRLGCQSRPVTDVVRVTYS